MSKTVEIEKVAMLVQIDGVMHQVALSQDNLRLLVNVATSLSDDGVLKVAKADESIRFADPLPQS